MKEVLYIHFSSRIWTKVACNHYAGLEDVPDLTPCYRVKKQLKKKADRRKIDYLDAVVQGAADAYLEAHIQLNDQGAPECTHCGQIVSGSALVHFAYYCSSILDLSEEGIESTQHLVEQARAELQPCPAKWLRGLLPLKVPDPLEPNYQYTSNYSRLDVSGKILGGDGSGGHHNKDFRTRRCGFGLAIIEHLPPRKGTIFDSVSFTCVGHARGTVPGKQSTPRAEASALLHALLTTTGDAQFVCDNLGVVRRFKHLATNISKSNGLLWSQIERAVRARKDGGHGNLEIIWIPSHITFKAAIARGYPAHHWLANQLADKLAGKAASECQISGMNFRMLADSTDLACSILQRLVDVCSHLAPKACRNLATATHSEPRIPKATLVEKWAKEAKHALDSNNRCVKCSLQIIMNRSQAYLEAVLHMNCLGSMKSLPCVSLHTRGQQDLAEDFSHYFFHGLRVHKTHTMATHGVLMLHFCSYCGAYGKSRSNNLQRECPPVASKYGKQALNMLALDRHPVNQDKDPEVPQAHRKAGTSRSSHSGKLRKPKLLLGLKSAFEGRAAVSAGAVKYDSRADPPVCNSFRSKPSSSSSKDIKTQGANSVCVRTVGPSVLRILATASATISKCLELLCPLHLLLES